MDGLLLVGTHVCALFGRDGARVAAVAEQRRGDAAVEPMSTHARTHVWSRDETSNYICIQSVMHKQTHQAQPTKGVLVAREIRNFPKESWAATYLTVHQISSTFVQFGPSIISRLMQCYCFNFSAIGCFSTGQTKGCTKHWIQMHNQSLHFSFIDIIMHYSIIFLGCSQLKWSSQVSKPSYKIYVYWVTIELRLATKFQTG